MFILGLFTGLFFAAVAGIIYAYSNRASIDAKIDSLMLLIDELKDEAEGEAKKELDDVKRALQLLRVRLGVVILGKPKA